VIAPDTVTRPGDGARVAGFLWSYATHTKGRWAGDRFAVESWQRDFLDEAFEVDPATGLRVYTEVLLGIPRKNGKTALAGGAGLYLLGWDGEAGAEVYAAAAARQQGYIVFGQAREMVGRSPRLADYLAVRRYYIECPANGGIFRVLSSDAPLQHGLNPSGNIIDELHAHKSPDLYVALTTGSGAREQPLTIAITTAGWDEETILGQIYRRALSLPDFEQRTPFLTIARDRANGFLMYWYGLPEGADLDDLRVWKGANPASWITESYLEREIHKPTMRPDDALRYHGNRWTRTEASMLPAGSWDRCASPLELDRKLPLHVGIDVGMNNDSTAVVAAQRQGKRTVVRSRVWANPYPPGHRLRQMWVTPMGEVLTYLRELRSQFRASACEIDGVPMEGPEFAFDPRYMLGEARLLEGEGLAMQKIDQTDQRMVPASMTFYRLVMEGALAHNGDPELAAQIANAIPHVKDRGWRISKPKGSSRKIDAAIAAAIAVWRAQEPTPERSVGAFLA